MESFNPIHVLSLALLGFFIVFTVLITLMGMIILISKLCHSLESNAKETKELKENTDHVEATKEEKPTQLDSGSYGTIILNDVPDETAAMLMAIVADTLKKPLNELRFREIRCLGTEEELSKKDAFSKSITQ